MALPLVPALYDRAMATLDAASAEAIPLREGGRIAIRPMTRGDVRAVRRVERAA